jgi:chromosome segregation ATPase
VESAQAEVGRLRESLAAGDERRRHAQSEFTALESQVAGVEDGEETLDAEYEDASAALDGILAEIDSLKAAERDAVRERDALKARHEALQLGLNRKDGSEHVLGAGVSGTVGPLAAALTVEPGYEAAVAAALAARRTPSWCGTPERRRNWCASSGTTTPAGPRCCSRPRPLLQVRQPDPCRPPPCRPGSARRRTW